MKIIGINGSPRVRWNTVKLLESSLKGAKSEGAETEIIHLYNLWNRGCVSCFSCKLKEGKSYGKCAMKDDLTSVLEKVSAADGVIIGTPVYFGSGSSGMRAFMERLLFPNITYTDPPASIFSGKLNVGLIYSMNANETQFSTLGIKEALGFDEKVIKIAFGNVETMYCHDTYQFRDYSIFHSQRFDVEAKEKRRTEVFPQDCKRAEDLGRKLAGKV